MKQNGTDVVDRHEVAAESPKQRCRCTVPMFTFNVSCVVLFWMIGYAYTTGVVRTLERRFGLSSSQSGLVLSSNDIMHVSVVIFVGYFGLRGNKPRLICVTTSLAALGNLLMSLPHWVYSYDSAPVSDLDCTFQLIMLFMLVVRQCGQQYGVLIRVLVHPPSVRQHVADVWLQPLLWCAAQWRHLLNTESRPLLS